MEKEIIEGNKLIAVLDQRQYKPVKAGYTTQSCNFIDKKFLTQEECLSFCDEINKGKHPDNCYFPLPDTYGFEWKYHLSYDWIITVMDKISKIVIKGHPPFNSDQYVRVEIVPNGYVKISNLRDTPITTNVSIEGSLIKALRSAAVKFLTWYNTQNK